MFDYGGKPPLRSSTLVLSSRQQFQNSSYDRPLKRCHKVTLIQLPTLLRWDRLIAVLGQELASTH